MNLRAEGLRAVAETAVLNNNYLAEKLSDVRGVRLPFPGACRRLKQVRYSWERLAEDTGVSTTDLARRITDYGLPRALVAPDVSVASVADLSAYGLLTAVEQKQQRDQMLQRFARMYAPAIGAGPVMDYLGQTGRDALKGADMLRTAPDRYSSDVEYAANPLADQLKDVSKVLLAGLGTRIFYTEHGGFDTHASQGPNHPKLWTEVSRAVADFWDDLAQHDAADNVMMFIFSEFGRRVKENGSGTDHGAAGVSFAVGPGVKGGMYSTYPETRAEALKDGDLDPNMDFRGVYSTVLEDWLGVDAATIVNGRFEKPGFIAAG